MPRFTAKTVTITIVVVAAVALMGVALLTVPRSWWPGSPSAGGTTNVDRPLATGMANPGVLRTDQGWVTMTTGDSRKPGHIHTAPELAGPWSPTDRPLLTRVAAWMNPDDKEIWAPSMARATDGSYRVYYAGLVKGDKHSRCIGVAQGADPRGPFTPDDRALACYEGAPAAHAHDTIPTEGRGFTLIDPTPAQLDGQLVLTYKTGLRTADGRWHTTNRMARLDPARPQQTLPNPVNADGRSVTITDTLDKDIEENPVLVKRGDRYTLFTSFGMFGTCDYRTTFRQSTDLWGGWQDKPRRDVPFPPSMRTCGNGNAHVTRGTAEDSWRIVFNGHPDRTTSGGPDALYTGIVDWTADGQPQVSRLL